MVVFSDHFWGEKHNGYEVLYQQMKLEEHASRDIVEFLRQFTTFQEQFSKNISRLSKQVSTYTPTSSFSPIWQVFKGSLEKLAGVHSDTAKPWQDLIKEVQKYADSLSKKHKTVKESESGTAEISLTMQHMTVALQKSRDLYHSRFAELSRISKQDNPSAKKIEKAEQEFKKAGDDYRVVVTKYNSTIEDFKTKMRTSAGVFQEAEEVHLRQIKAFFRQYSSVHEEKHTEIGEVYYEFHTKLDELTVDKLLETCVDGKGIGKTPPEPVVFEDVDRSTLPVPINLEDIDVGTGTDGKKQQSTPQQKGEGGETGNQTSGTGAAGGSMMHINISGIFKKRRKKKKNKGGDTTIGEGSEKNSSTTSLPEVDAEGFVIRKDEDGAKDADSWYSSSDDEDGNGEDGHRDSEERTHSRLKVAIKPLEGVTDVFDAEQHLANLSSNANSLSSSNLKSSTGSGGSQKPPASADALATSPFSGFFDPPPSSGTSSSPRIGVHRSTTKAVSPAIADLLSLDFDSISTVPDKARNGEHGGSVWGSSSGGVTGGPISAEDKEVGEAWVIKDTLDTWKSTGSKSVALDKLVAPPSIPRPPSRKDLTTFQRARSLGDALASIPKSGGVSTTFGASGTGNIATTFGPSANSTSKPSPRGLNRSPLTVQTTGSPITVPRPGTPSSVSSPAGSVSSLSSTPGSSGIPLALAITETINAFIKSPRESSLVKITGEILISFPVAALRTMLGSDGPSSLPTLSFQLCDNLGVLEHVHSNKTLVTSSEVSLLPSATDADGSSNSLNSSETGEGSLYSFNMSALCEHLSAQRQANPAASYFNIEVIKYTVRVPPGSSSPSPGAAGGPRLPLAVMARWKCEPTRTDLRIDYRYMAGILSHPAPLTGVSFLVPVNGGVKKLQADPQGEWSPDHAKYLWKVDRELGPGNSTSPSSSEGGCIKASLDLGDGSQGPSVVAPVAAHFVCDGATHSGVNFNVAAAGYRVSFTKRRLCSGRFLVEAEGNNSAKVV